MPVTEPESEGTDLSSMRNLEAENATLEARIAAQNAIILELKGNLLSLMLEVSVLRDIVAETSEYRQYFGCPCVVRQGSSTVHGS